MCGICLICVCKKTANLLCTTLCALHSITPHYLCMPACRAAEGSPEAGIRLKVGVTLCAQMGPTWTARRLPMPTCPAYVCVGPRWACLLGNALALGDPLRILG